MIPRPCPRCGTPAPAGGCDEHRVATKAVRNAEAAACAEQVRRSPRCACCAATEDLTAGHIVAVVLGGRAADGLVTLCRPCNASAGAGGRCQLEHH